MILKPNGTLEQQQSKDTNFRQFQIELKGASGVPVPHDARAEDVVQRSVRVILFHDSPANAREDHFVGNSYRSPAFQHRSKEDCWTFPSLKQVDGDNKFVVRTDRRVTHKDDGMFLLVELTVTLRSLKVRVCEDAITAFARS